MQLKRAEALLTYLAFEVKQVRQHRPRAVSEGQTELSLDNSRSLNELVEYAHRCTRPGVTHQVPLARNRRCPKCHEMLAQ